MAYLVKGSDLNHSKYRYTDKRDAGDGPSRGILDRMQVDKNETYEVVRFIQSIVTEFNISSKSISIIEDSMHKFSSTKMRDELKEKVLKDLKLGFREYISGKERENVLKEDNGMLSLRKILTEHHSHNLFK